MIHEFTLCGLNYNPRIMKVTLLSYHPDHDTLFCRNDHNIIAAPKSNYIIIKKLRSVLLSGNTEGALSNYFWKFNIIMTLGGSAMKWMKNS